MTEKKNQKDKKVLLTRPTWQMALPTLVNAVRSDDEDMQQKGINQLAVLAVIVDKVWSEATKDSDFKERISHLNILMKEEEKKDGQ